MGIIWVLDGNIHSGAYFVLIAAGFDFLDGFVARLLKVQSDIGKELDSLADVVSFGVLPGVILFALIRSDISPEGFSYLPLIVPLLSAYRLAKFNLDSRQSDRFIGLPTPANAMLLSTIPHLAERWPTLGTFLMQPWVVIGIAWIFAVLLIIELPLIALKFKDFSLRKNTYRYILIGLGLVAISWLQLAGVPLLILSYIGLSILEQVAGNE